MSRPESAPGPSDALVPSRRGEVLLPLLLLAVATVLFWVTRLDLWAADLFRTPCCSWPLAEQPLWRFLYRYGVFSGFLLAAFALVALTLSYWYPRRLHYWRRPALFLVLTAALGPGLLVNVAFKDHYGRPRPREVRELGGEERFLPVWVKGEDTQAKSFPCGHCSMGFYLATPYLLFRRRRPALARASLAAGIAAGFTLGLARMMAGGHFLSDVVWAGGMVWITALFLHRLLRVDLVLSSPPPPVRERDRRKARLATAAAGAALLVLTLATLLATPYFSAKSFTQTEAQLAALPSARLEVRMDRATLEVVSGPDLELSYEVRAFGLPNSRVGFSFHPGPEAAVLALEQWGLFTERRLDAKLRLPAAGPRPVRLYLGRGRLTLDLRGFAPLARLEVRVGEGEVRVLGAEALERGSVLLRVEKGRIIRE